MKTVKRFGIIFLLCVITGCSLGSPKQQPSPVIDQSGAALHVWMAGESRSLEVFDAFTASTGIPVQVTFGTQEELFQQVLESKGAPEADLFWSNNAIDLSILSGLGAFEPYKSPLQSSLPGHAFDRDGLWHGLTVRTLALVYSAAVFTDDVPTTVEQMIDSRWLDELTVPPASSPLWNRILADIAVFEGETELKQFLDKLVGMSLTFADDSTEDIQSVITGAGSVLLTTTENALRVMTEQKQRPQDIRIQPVGSKHTEQIDIVTGIGILRGTEKKEAAGTFIDFLLKESNREALAQELAHDTLTNSETAREVRTPRLHPNEIAQLVPLIERYWQLSFAETS